MKNMDLVTGDVLYLPGRQLCMNQLEAAAGTAVPCTLWVVHPGGLASAFDLGRQV
jgi:hypothetical protein